MKKILTSAIIFLLVLPTFSVFIPQVFGAANPNPDIISVDYPSHVEFGQSVSIRADGTNWGGESPEAYLSISLPSNPTEVSITSTNAPRQEIYWPGDEIWGEYGTRYPMTVRYPLAEVWDTSWMYREEHYLIVETTPESSGTFVFYVKMVVKDNDEDRWIADPRTDGSESSRRDQQNEYVYRYTIDVFEDPYFADSYWDNKVDVDGDGYYRSVTANWDADIDADVHVDVYVEVEGRDSDGIMHFLESYGTYTIYDNQVDYKDLDVAVPHRDVWDLKLELYEWDGLAELVDDRWYYNVPMEPASEDEALGSLTVFVKYPGGNLIGTSELNALIIYWDSSHDIIEPVPTNPYTFSDLDPNDYLVEAYVNDMYSHDTGWVYLSGGDSKSRTIYTPEQGKLRIQALCNDGVTPLSDAYVEIESHDGTVWRSDKTDSDGWTTWFWLQPTNVPPATAEYYKAKVYYDGSKRGESGHITFASGESKGVPVKTDVPLPWVTITGHFYYWDDEGNQKFVDSALVELYDEDWEFDDLLDSTYTASNGYFVLGPVENIDNELGESGTRDLYVRGYARNWAVNVVGPGVTEGTYEFRTATIDDVADGEHDWGNMPVPAAQYGPFNVLTVITRGNRYVNILDNTPPQVLVVWPDDDEDAGSSYGLRLLKGTAIYLEGPNSASTETPEPDEFSDPVILHEYGHFIMDEYAEFPPRPRTNDQQNWVEGWAQFFQAPIRHHLNGLYPGLYPHPEEYCDTPGGICGIDLEEWTDVPSEYNWIASILWDIYDGPPDFPSDDQDGDGIGDGLHMGFDEIWDVLKNYDPDLGDNSHDHPWTIHEFWDGWFAQGHGHQQEMWAVFYEHGINKDNTDPNNPTSYWSVHQVMTWSNDNTIEVIWSGATDDISGVQGYSFVWDSSPDTIPPEVDPPYTGTLSISPPLSDGTSWYLHVRAVDRAGNWADDAYHVGPFYIETTPPNTPSPDADPSDWSTDTTPTVYSYSVSDAGAVQSGINRYEYQIDSTAGTWTSVLLASSFNVPPQSDGIHTVYVRAVDNAGNPSILGPIDIFIDTTKPHVEISFPPEGYTTKTSSIEVEWSGSDVPSGIDHYEVKLDAGPWIPIDLSTSYTFSGLSRDGHTVYVKAIDKADLETIDGHSFEFAPYQLKDYYCGPASLEMVLDYYGVDISQFEIADAARTDSRYWDFTRGKPAPGTYLEDMIRAAHFSDMSWTQGVDEPAYTCKGYTNRDWGYSAFYYAPGTPWLNELKTLVDDECWIIVSTWYDTRHETGHYRVVIDYDDFASEVILHDPWDGPSVRFSYDEFLDLWSRNGYWGLFVHPWEVSVVVPESVAPATYFTVTTTITYICPEPFSTIYYPATEAEATINLPLGFSLAYGETQTKALGTLAAGTSSTVSWLVLASSASNIYAIDVFAQGIVSGSVGDRYDKDSNKIYSAYSYQDRIGGSGSSTLEVETHDTRVEIISGDHALVDRFIGGPNPSQVTLGAQVKDTVTGAYLYHTGSVEFYVNEILVGIDTDEDRDAIYRITWNPPEDWLTLGSQTWEAAFTGTSSYNPSSTLSRLTIYGHLYNTLLSPSPGEIPAPGTYIIKIAVQVTSDSPLEDNIRGCIVTARLTFESTFLYAIPLTDPDNDGIYTAIATIRVTGTTPPGSIKLDVTSKKPNYHDGKLLPPIIILTIPTFHLVEAAINPVTATVQSGTSFSYIVSIRNTGNVRDTYDLTLTGLDASWHTFALNPVTLDPDQTTTAALAVSPPASLTPPDLTDYSFTVKATCRVDPTAFDTVDAVISVVAPILAITADSPVNILVTASNGLRVGYDPETGATINEIPGATYSGPGSDPQVIKIPNPLEGNYLIDIFGTGTGTYTITMESLASDGSTIDTATWTGTTESGQHDTQNMNLADGIITDATGPTTTDTTVTPTPTIVNPALTANVTDALSTVVTAEYFIDTTGAHGTGIPLSAVDGAFDELSEEVAATISISALIHGEHTVYVHGKDAANNWGDFDSFTFVVVKTHLLTVEAFPLDASGGTFLATYTLHQVTYIDEEHTTPWTTEADVGTTVTISSPQQILDKIPDDETRYAYTSGAGTITMDSDKTVTLVYKTQYYLTMSTNFGTVSPDSAWFDAGTTLTIEVKAPSVIEGERYVWNGWCGTGSGSYSGTDNPSSATMNDPITQIASWTHQFYLEIEVVNEIGTDISSLVPIPGEGWYDAGTETALTAPRDVEFAVGSRYDFRSWTRDVSDTTNTISVTMTAPRAVTAHYMTQYYLTVNNGGHGTASGEGWYDSRVSAAFSISPTIVYEGDGTRYVFTQWSGDSTSTNPSDTTLMDGPKTVDANWKTQYQVTFEQTGSGATTYVTYIADTDPLEAVPFTVWAKAGSMLTFSYDAMVNDGQPTRYVLVSVDHASPLTVNWPATITATYKTQHYLTLEHSPIDPILDSHQTGQGYYDADSIAEVTADLYVDIVVGSARYMFVHWSGDASGTSTATSIIMSGPKTATANHKIQYYITVTSAHDSPTPSAWVDAGSDFTASVTSPTEIVPNDHQWVCTGFSIDSEALQTDTSYTFTDVQAAHTIEFAWKEQFWIQVNSSHDLPTTSLWIDQGDSLTVGVTSPADDDGMGTRYRCTGYTLDSNPPVTDGSTSYTFENIQNAHTITFNWIAQYYLTTSTNFGDVSPSSGWYDVGTEVTILASPPDVIPNERYVWNGWSGTGIGSYSGPDNPATITMNSPIIEAASWAHQYYISVSSAHDAPTSSSWIDQGNDFTASVTSPTEVVDGDHQWVCTGFSVDGGPAQLGTSYTFLNVQAPHTITFNWKKQFWIQVSSDHDSPTPSDWVDLGDSFTASVDSPADIKPEHHQWVCSGFTVDDGPLQSGTSHTFINVQAPHTIVFSWWQQFWVTLTYTGDITGQYSDPTSVSVILTVTETGQALEHKKITFTIGDQSTTATTNEDGIAATSITITQPTCAPGVAVEFLGDKVYLPRFITEGFTINKEDALVDYTGDTVVPTSARTINLRATVYDSDDGSWGDLTKFNVTFNIYVGQLGSSNLWATIPAVPVCQTETPGVGVAIMTIGNLPENGYLIIVKIDENNYYRGPTSDATALTVYEPTGEFVTGGGWIWDSTGSKGNFGFNVKYTKSGKPKGHSVYVYREGGWNYIVKSNAWIGLAIEDDHAYLEAKCVVQKYNPETEELAWDEGNYKFRVDAWDNDSDGGIDIYQIRVLDKNGVLFHEAGFDPLGELQGGNIVIHDEKKRH